MNDEELGRKNFVDKLKLKKLLFLLVDLTLSCSILLHDHQVNGCIRIKLDTGANYIYRI